MEQLGNLLPQSIPQNSVPAQQESKLQKSSEEEMLMLALQDPAIYHSELEDLKEVLRAVLVKLGLRSVNWPTEDEKQLLIDHILTNYGGHTHAEIKLAFDMAIAGKLDVEANCYENFSCLYFSTVMNAYRLWASEAKRQLDYKRPVEPVEKKSTEQFQLSDEEWFLSIKDQVLAGKLSVLFIPIEMYVYLEKKGELELTTAEKHAYMDKAIEFRHKVLSDGVTNVGDRDARQALTQFNIMREKGFEGSELNKLKDLARKIAVFEYIQTISL